MKQALASVTEFHKKYGFAVGNKLQPTTSLASVARKIQADAAGLNPDAGVAQCRSHLILEETGELLEALAIGNELDTLDALADLIYVVVGTAVAFGLPLAEAFEQVHRSNMTKAVVRSRPGHPCKGQKYIPPDLTSLLS